MNSNLIKETLREIWRSRNRFFSILGIVALGVGFFAGVKATCPDMKLTMEHYYEDTALADVHLISTYGFNDNDLKAIEEVSGIRGMMPAYSVDAFIGEGEKSDTIVKVLSLDTQTDQNDPNTLNKPVLKEGRFPEAPGECVVEKNIHSPEEFAIGNTVSLIAGKEDEEITDTLKVSTYQIVGIVESSSFIAFDRGKTQIGDGEIDAFMMIPKEDFKLDVYTDVYLTMDETQGLSPFEQPYKDAVKSIDERFEEVAVTRESERYREIMTEAQQKIDDAKKELADGQSEADAELADGQQKISDAQQEIADGGQKLEASRKEYNTQIAAAQKKLDDARAELESQRQKYEDGLTQYKDGLAQYEDGLTQYNAGLAQFEAEKPAALQKLSGFVTQRDALQKQVDDGEKQISDTRSLIASISGVVAAYENDYTANPPAEVAAVIAASAGLDALLPAGSPSIQTLLQQYVAMDPTAFPVQKETLKAQIVGMLGAISTGLDTQETNLQQAKDAITQLNEGITQGYAALDATQQQLDNTKIKLDETKTLLDSTKQELDAAPAQFAEAQQQIEAGQAELDSQKETGAQALAEAETKLADGQTKLDDARKEYDEGKAEADQKIADGQKEITDAEQKLNDVKKPVWYVWDRNDNPGYSGYQDDAEKVDAIAQVFPMFFILVAALVCLTTMTRMVEEKRTEIGTLKALGYSKRTIMAKYLWYAISASLIGSVIGLIIGFTLFPSVIISAYHMRYFMPDAMLPFRWDYALWCTAAAVAVTGISAWAAGYKELSEQPAQLMRPKAPPSGKRVLLEKWTWFWKKLNFTQKVTIRNIFRYKKRVLMTVIGIAGCTALMLTGFGLQYSIGSIVSKQFQEIFVYDAMGALDSDITADGISQLRSEIENTPNVKNDMMLSYQAMDAKSNGDKISVSTYVPEQPSQISEYVTLRTRDGHTPLTLGNDGAIVNEKLAKLLNLKTGDTFMLTDADGNNATVTIVGITENYTMNYVYMTPEYYSSVFGHDAPVNAFVLNMTEGADLSALSEKLLSYDNVEGLSYANSTVKQFSDIVDSLGSIVLVLIISAGALAFIVMYNLVNINVTERMRELATIKVLGFYDGEVSAYIYRENTISAVIGMFVGLIAGVFLEKFVIATAEVDIVMFAPEIPFTAFLYAGALTMVFAFIVNFVLHFKLKKIDMVESMKSIE
ncbi:MAG: FtsX-like permease family protein [Christensenella sp.]|nr:FtsX-like permease family protein [Christensenella sp.]